MSILSRSVFMCVFLLPTPLILHAGIVAAGGSCDGVRSDTMYIDPSFGGGTPGTVLCLSEGDEKAGLLQMTFQDTGVAAGQPFPAKFVVELLGTENDIADSVSDIVTFTYDRINGGINIVFLSDGESGIPSSILNGLQSDLMIDEKAGNAVGHKPDPHFTDPTFDLSADFFPGVPVGNRPHTVFVSSDFEGTPEPNLFPVVGIALTMALAGVRRRRL